jgi:Protein of unknown function (DUF4236)
MGFRFRRSIKILPGIRLNFGKRGVSTSIGVRGAHVTVGRTGTRTTVGLPGSGLSYTHLEKPHHEAAIASAEPDNYVPKGKAWRGWLWIALLVAGVTVAALSISCSNQTPPPQPPPVAVIPPPAAPDPRIAYDLQEKCGRDAREWFKHFYGDGQSHTKDFSSSSYRNHYSAKLHRCFALLSSFSILRDDKTKKMKSADDQHLVDINENNDIGTYFKFSDMQTPMSCSLEDQKCGSPEEWKMAIGPYLEQ